MYARVRVRKGARARAGVYAGSYVRDQPFLSNFLTMLKMCRVNCERLKPYLRTSLHSDGHGGRGRLRQGHADGHSRTEALDGIGWRLSWCRLLFASYCRSTAGELARLPHLIDAQIENKKCGFSLPTPPVFWGPAWSSRGRVPSGWAPASSLLPSLLFPSCTDEGRDASTSTSSTRIVSWPDIAMT